MRIVITGAGGFIGSFLQEALAERGDDVAAWTHRTVDVTQTEAVAEAFERFAPEAVVHLAARSLPARSWTEPAETYRVNVGGTINILEAARRCDSPPRILLAGSSAEYAEPVDAQPITEDAPLEPNSPYAASKVAVNQLGELYCRQYGLHIVGFRPFALVGPRKIGDVCSDFARRVVAIERKNASEMVVGDVSVVRDLIDVRDGVAGLLRLIDDGKPGEMYNICSGRGHSIADILQTLRRLATVPVKTVQDPALLRPLEHKVKIGDPSKLQALRWRAVRTLDDTLADILAYWRVHERKDS
jgi:GDP-4-dehydro-6-deoxy-D-mannose reductase